MENKKVWDHLSKELAKASTVVDLSLEILDSVLFSKPRYNIFISIVLDSFTRTIFLTFYHLFDKQYSWCLYSLKDLSTAQSRQIENLKSQSSKYIKVRHQEVGHASRKVKLEDHRRVQWFPEEELEKIKELFKEISRFLNAYGMEKFNEGYAIHFGGPDTSLRCLIEDLERLEKSRN